MTARSAAPALLLPLAVAVAGCAGDGGTVEITTRSVLEDKVRGGWAGQMIGVSFGAPTEFSSLEAIIPEDSLPEWRPERVEETLDQDDLYVDMTFAAVLDEKGLDATTEDFGAMFRNAEYRLWHANLAARRALRRGVPASLTGTPEHNAHANDIDFQIEADFIGLMAPGMPEVSNDYCLRAGRVMNAGDGILGGVFVSAMYSAAFFESDTRRIVEAGLATLPPGSPYARLIADVLAWSEEHPDDWTAVWRLIEETWNAREPCPQGALDPFNIDAKINGAYVALGLLYGEGDMHRTMAIATRAGQDSDCNPASAAGILGVVLGYGGIPDELKSGIDAIADERFSYTDYSFNTIVRSTMDRMLALVERNGGTVDGDRVTIRVQEPSPVDVEVWDDYGSPVERIPVEDARWAFSGSWREGEWSDRRTAAAGADATIAFDGTGAILVGAYMPTGGTADVYLDGALDRTVDVYPDEEGTKWEEAVWHAFDLAPGPHELRVVVRGEPYRGVDGDESDGANISLSSLVVFR